MEKQQITRWFLGANSGNGFSSLYEGFCRGDGDFLRVIKGGPGCGKSSFMKTIGRAAEDARISREAMLQEVALLKIHSQEHQEVILQEKQQQPTQEKYII